MAIRARQIIWITLLLAMAAPWQRAFAEDPEAIEVPQPGLRTTTLAEYTSQLAGLRDLLAACRVSAAACDAEKIGSDNRVTEAGFNVHWGWLREVMVKAKDQGLNSKDRAALLDEAAERLDDQAREAGLPVALTGVQTNGQTSVSDAAIPFTQARRDADKVLAGAEFRKVTRSSYWDEMLGKLGGWLDRLFGGVSSLGEHHRWLGPLVEWSFVALALIGVLVWASRAMQRQRLAIRFEGPAGGANWQEASRNWASLAQAAAENGEWRDAVHALYWASVTELEGRRVWRQNNARTPREYLRLVQTNAPQYQPLRQLTLALERIWYGLAEAKRSDYDRAMKLYEELRAA